MKNCEYCGKEFKPKSKIQKYCCNKCKVSAGLQKRKENGYKINSITYTCKNCGKEYHPIDKRWNTFCSQECCYDWLAKNKKPELEKVKPQTKICINCSKKFETKSNAKVECDDCIREKHKNKLVLKLKAEARQRYADEAEPRTCAYCGKIFTPKFGKGWTTVKYCASECARKSQSISEAKKEERRRYRARKRGAYVERVITKRIYERDNGRCMLCGKKIDINLKHPHPMSLSIDHIVPLSLGGTHEPSNVQCAHLICNSTKGNKAVGEQLRIY